MGTKQAAGRIEDRTANSVRTPLGRRHWTRFLAAAALLVCSAHLASQHLAAQQIAPQTLPDEPAAQNQTASSKTPAAGGSISGVVVDETGAAITTATVRLTLRDPARSFDTKTDADGGFTFPNPGSGAFLISVAAPGFTAVSVPGNLSAGQVYTLPAITLEVGSSTVVNVGVTREEMAQEQLNVETKQRFLGVIPNFYMSYDPHPLPLSPKQKFTLAAKFTLDPASFAITGLTAGVQQANDDYSGFGRGIGGYGKRYAAATGTFLNAAILGGAVLPSVLHQDPRYFYKGTGSIKSRTLYAIANAVICKGDNGHWEPNYSSIGGGLAAGAISNFYYPAKNRDGVESTFVNAAIGIAEDAAGNVAQEFLFRRLTSHTERAP